TCGDRMTRRLLVLAATVALGATSVRAQATDTARYAVAYGELNAASLPQATKTFHAYRQAAMAEPGFVAFDLFEQLGRAGHFVLVETWRDQATFDAHQTAASASTLKDALQSIRVSGYDQRPHKTLTLMPAQAH